MDPFVTVLIPVRDKGARLILGRTRGARRLAQELTNEQRERVFTLVSVLTPRQRPRHDKWYDLTRHEFMAMAGLPATEACDEAEQ